MTYKKKRKNKKKRINTEDYCETLSCNGKRYLSKDGDFEV